MVNRVMTVSERRYLQKNSTVFRSGQIFGVCSTKPLGICTWSVKAQIFDHFHMSPIDIALKKLSLPYIVLAVYHVDVRLARPQHVEVTNFTNLPVYRVKTAAAKLTADLVGSSLNIS